jgi:ATP-dependent helicase/DNAse subunit B
VSAFLTDEAKSDRALQPSAEMLEASFDVEDDPDRPPLDLGGLRLHGKIDRVDLVETPEGRFGLVTDYKLSREVTPAAKLEEEGKLQLQLYALAVKRLWGIEPAGSVYLPLRATTDRKRRGILRKDLVDTALAGLAVVGNDLLEPEEFEQKLAEGESRAVEIAAAIRGGRVRRDPIDNQCPSYCHWQTICRRERGVGEIEDPEDEEREE